MGISIRSNEEVQDFDWVLDETDESGFFQLAVPAVDIHQAGNPEIVAVCLQERYPVYYLMDADCRLYYSHWSDRFVEQFFPIEAYLRWRNSWKWGIFFLAEKPFPDGWCYFQGIFSDIHFVVTEGLRDEFRQAKAEKEPYDVYRGFPRVIEKALLLKQSKG